LNRVEQHIENQVLKYFSTAIYYLMPATPATGGEEHLKASNKCFRIVKRFSPP
jgi:hypothetical protein